MPAWHGRMDGVMGRFALPYRTSLTQELAS